VGADEARYIEDRVKAHATQPLPLGPGDLVVRRLEEVIGDRMLARRTELGLTQEQVGARMGRLLGREWTRQAVSAAEKGRRAFTAVELVAIANVLGETLSALLTPPSDVKAIELGELTEEGGLIMTQDLSWALMAASPVAGESLWELQNALLRLGQHLRVLDETVGLITEDLTAIKDIGAQAVADKGTETGEAQQ